MGTPIIFGMFLNVQNSYLSLDASSETNVFTKQTATSSDEEGKSATIASHTRTNGERQMQLQTVHFYDTTQFRASFHHLANRYVLLNREELGPTLGVIQKSENQRNPNAPTFGERSIEWTLRMEEVETKSACTLHQSVNKIPGS